MSDSEETSARSSRNDGVLDLVGAAIQFAVPASMKRFSEENSSFVEQAVESLARTLYLQKERKPAVVGSFSPGAG